MDWRDRGLCLSEDPELFFPIGSANSGPWAVQTDRAKAVCRQCPVAERCLAWAVEAGPVEGIWGGTTEGERHALQRRMARRPAVRSMAG